MSEKKTESFIERGETEVKTESRIQSESFVWFNNAYPDLRGLLYHVPNGEFRDKITASRLKALGVVAGIPDIAFHFKAKTWFIEFKDAKGRVSKDQEAIHSKMREQGFIVFIIRDVEHFKQTITGIIQNDNSDPFKIGSTKEEYYYRHKVFDFLYNQLSHGELMLIDDLVEGVRKVKFIELVKEFIRFRFDEKDGFELLFTEDFEAFYRRDKGKAVEPIFYRGKSIPQ